MSLELFLKNIGKNIAELRRKKALNQKTAAEKADLSYRYYQSIEAGDANLTLSTVFRIADFLEVPPSRILCPEAAPERC